MTYPEFFDTIESIKLEDKLASFLGSIEDGKVEFNYIDVVKSAGHSCPTVAGAYISVLEGLKVLYKDEIPIRGEIYVSFKENATEGVAGVIANVVTHITGATATSGFKGLGGEFIRHSLMEFDANIETSMKLQRLDNGACVEITYDPSSVLPYKLQQELMQKIMQGKASCDEKKEFGILWQDRVRRIFENISNVISVK